MSQESSVFIELLQISLGCRKELSRIPTETEWNDVFVTLVSTK